jgi:hypothetical protein
MIIFSLHWHRNSLSGLFNWCQGEAWALISVEKPAKLTQPLKENTLKPALTMILTQGHNGEVHKVGTMP